MVDGSIDFTCLGFYVERDIICICLVQICDQILIRIINSDIQIAHMDRDWFFTLSMPKQKSLDPYHRDTFQALCLSRILFSSPFYEVCLSWSYVCLF